MLLSKKGNVLSLNWNWYRFGVSVFNGAAPRQGCDTVIHCSIMGITAIATNVVNCALNKLANSFDRLFIPIKEY